jgi:hypothetical protein
MGIDKLYYCPHCGTQNDWCLPVEPLYTLNEVATVLNCTTWTIHHHLHVLGSPKFYSRDGVRPHLSRKIPASQVKEIRNRMLRTGNIREGNLKKLCDLEENDG